MNTVMIMVDQQKASSLPMYGNPIVHTPNLEALAQEGCLFRQASTPARSACRRGSARSPVNILPPMDRSTIRS